MAAQTWLVEMWARRGLLEADGDIGPALDRLRLRSWFMRRNSGFKHGGGRQQSGPKPACRTPNTDLLRQRCEPPRASPEACLAAAAASFGTSPSKLRGPPASLKLLPQSSLPARSLCIEPLLPLAGSCSFNSSDVETPRSANTPREKFADLTVYLTVYDLCHCWNWCAAALLLLAVAPVVAQLVAAAAAVAVRRRRGVAASPAS